MPTPLTISPSTLQSLAIELSLMGGQTAARLHGSVSTTRKPDNSPVTEADHAVQAAILDVIAARHPEHAVLVEETLATPARHASLELARYCWVVDPIDGTRNFGRGLTMYAVSVAVLLDGSPIAGAIYDADQKQVYSAAKSEGAFRDGMRLTPGNRDIDADTTIALSSFRLRQPPRAVRGWVDKYLFRNLGSLCLHLAWVAGGLADAAFAQECKLWDLAAGALIVAEAGGAITNAGGGPLWPIDVAGYRSEDLPVLAGTPRVHAELLRSLLAVES